MLHVRIILNKTWTFNSFILSFFQPTFFPWLMSFLSTKYNAYLLFEHPQHVFCEE